MYRELRILAPHQWPLLSILVQSHNGSREAAPSLSSLFTEIQEPEPQKKLQTNPIVLCDTLSRDPQWGRRWRFSICAGRTGG